MLRVWWRSNKYQFYSLWHEPIFYLNGGENINRHTKDMVRFALNIVDI
jgi:hypothetical protein